MAGDTPKLHASLAFDRISRLCELLWNMGSSAPIVYIQRTRKRCCGSGLTETGVVLWRSCDAIQRGNVRLNRCHKLSCPGLLLINTHNDAGRLIAPHSLPDALFYELYRDDPSITSLIWALIHWLIPFPSKHVCCPTPQTSLCI